MLILTNTTGASEYGQPADADRIMVRARVRGYLEALKDRFARPQEPREIQELVGAGDAYRLFEEKSAWEHVVVFQVTILCFAFKK